MTFPYYGTICLCSGHELHPLCTRRLAISLSNLAASVTFLASLAYKLYCLPLRIVSCPGLEHISNIGAQREAQLVGLPHNR